MSTLLRDATPSRAPRGRFKKLATSAAIVTIAGVGGAILPATSAQAVQATVGYATWSGFLGTELFDGYNHWAICIDAMDAGPTIMTDATTVSDPIVDYLLRNYINTQDNDTAAALALVVKRAYDSHPDRVEAALAETGRVAEIEAIATAMVNDAYANAGPFTGTVSMTQDLNNPRIGTVSMGILNRQSNYVGGVSVTATISGPAVFDATGTNTFTYTTSNAPGVTPWRATGNGDISITLTSNSGLPDGNWTMRPPQGAGYQRTAAPGGGYVYPTAFDPVGFDAIFDYSPKIATNTSQQDANAGSPISDTVTISGGAPNSTVTVTNTLYGPLAAPPTLADAAPSGTGKVGTLTQDVTLDANGTATFTMGPLTVPEAGWYVWQESLAGGSLPDGTKWNPFTGKFGEETEATNSHQAVLARTQTSHLKIASPGAISDKIDVTGIYPGFKGTITADLYGPIAPKVGQTCDEIGTAEWAKAIAATPALKFATPATIAVDGDKAVNGELTVDTEAVVTGEAGCYTWGESLVNDSTKTKESTTKPGDVNENTLVVKPAMVTQTSRMVALPGKTVLDTIKVTGIVDETAKMEATLWGPVKVDAMKDCSSITKADWEKAIKDGTVKPVADPETIDVTRDGTYTTKEIEVPELGCYTWTEKMTLDDVVDKNGDKVVSETPPGVVEETTLVMQPEITTVAKANIATVDALITDDITVKGLHNQAATITGRIYGPMLRTGETCDGIDWSKAPIAGEIAPIKISADGTVTSNEFKIPAVGCYTYVEELTIDSTGEQFANTKPGETLETLYFKAKAGDGKGGDGIQAGMPNAALPVGGLILVALGGGLYVLRRRNRRADES